MCADLRGCFMKCPLKSETGCFMKRPMSGRQFTKPSILGDILAHCKRHYIVLSYSSQF